MFVLQCDTEFNSAVFSRAVYDPDDSNIGIPFDYECNRMQRVVTTAVLAGQSVYVRARCDSRDDWTQIGSLPEGWLDQMNW
jgi:hypothetical protein